MGRKVSIFFSLPTRDASFSPLKCTRPAFVIFINDRAKKPGQRSRVNYPLIINGYAFFISLSIYIPPFDSSMRPNNGLAPNFDDARRQTSDRDPGIARVNVVVLRRVGSML